MSDSGTGPRPVLRKRRGCLIAAIVVLVVSCGIAALAGALLLFGARGDADAVRQAEVHFSAAVSAVESATAAVSEGVEVKKDVLAAASGSVRISRDELAASRAAIEPIEDRAGKSDYLAALAAGTDALDAMEEMLAYLGTASGIAAKVTDAADAATRANRKLNDAIDAGNAARYAKMRSQAQAAAADLLKAATLFDDAHRLDASAGLDQSAAQLRKRAELANLVVAMAEDGAAGRTREYNDKIDDMNTLEDAAAKIADPAIYSQDDWAAARLESLGARLEDSSARADELRAKALDALQ